MNGRDYTTMGGSHEAFLTTDWGVIEQMRSVGEAPSSDVLINDLLGRYWKPVYCYLRRKGYDNEQAKDLTQGFFQAVVLGRSLVAHADKSRGRFRTLLLTALQQYLAGVYRRENTQKRTPKGELVALDELDPDEMPEAPPHFSPEESFHYAWAAQLLDQLLAEVEAKCRREGKALHWQVFREHVLQPILENVAAPSLPQICRRHGIESASQASNMIVTVNRRFRAALKRHIRRSVAQDSDVEAEFRELVEVFTRSGAR
jgi:DNA-directed RNA polymerase specialized sigma24 family protein